MLQEQEKSNELKNRFMYFHYFIVYNICVCIYNIIMYFFYIILARNRGFARLIANIINNH